MEGDENQPITQGRLCVRCLTLKDYLYNPSRITYPLKRAKEHRGQADKWERCTWDEALDIIEENGETAYYVHCLDVSQYEDKNFYYTDEDGKEKPLPLHRSREDAGEDIKGTMEKWIRRIWE